MMPPQELPNTDASGAWAWIAAAILSSLCPITAFTIHRLPFGNARPPYIMSMHSSTARVLSAMRTLAELKLSIGIASPFEWQLTDNIQNKFETRQHLQYSKIPRAAGQRAADPAVPSRRRNGRKRDFAACMSTWTLLLSILS
jgi:hypothetical protein